MAAKKQKSKSKLSIGQMTPRQLAAFRKNPSVVKLRSGPTGVLSATTKFEVRKLRDFGKYDPRSIRPMSVNPGMSIVVGCPTGNFDPRGTTKSRLYLKSKGERGTIRKGKCGEPMEKIAELRVQEESIREDVRKL